MAISPLTSKKRIHWYFTWNSVQKNNGIYTVIFGDYYEARRKMVAHWGDDFCGQYPSLKAGGIENFEEVITPGGKKPIVNYGNRWSVAEDRKLMSSMKRKIKLVATRHNRTEKAIIDRLRTLYNNPTLLKGERQHSYD